MKEYKSFFTQDTINVSNYICELLIANRLKWLKKPLPQCPFWRKEYTNQDKSYAELAKLYQLEVIGITQLLKVFNPHIVATYFLKNNTVGFKTIKKENQNKIILDLYHEQSTQKEIAPTNSSDMSFGGNVQKTEKNTLGLLDG